MIIEASGEMTQSKLPAGLYVVATPIGHRGDITLRALITLAQADFIAAEDTRTTGSLLTAYGLHKALISYTEHKDEQRTPQIIAHIRAGKAVALVSDAGLPLIADPGQRLVQAVVSEGLPVTVIPGANAALTALAGSGLAGSGLAGSGLAGEGFYFMGFLPHNATARKKVLEGVIPCPAPLIIYESPHRLAESLADMAAILGPDRPAAVARELTKLYEETRRGTLSTLAQHVAEHGVKGEIVVVVAPASEPAAAILSEADIDALLQNLLRTHSLRDAVAEAMAATGQKKSILYARALTLMPKD
jgi:16S rRNA (cytidine1402-2'-O)-methyltransferase